MSFSLYKHVTDNETVGSTKISADDALAKFAPDELPIPVKARSDPDFELPDSDLLNALHYYVGRTYPHKTRAFDETALLALGTMVEDWVDELLEENGHQIYAEFANEDELEELQEKYLRYRKDHSVYMKELLKKHEETVATTDGDEETDVSQIKNENSD